ncbi:CGH_1_HP_G0103820.mRNA.1.CDS.1 [Saccharomyces cerevisiae]|nr:CGH_1_HP_G0103820.mRNA.1.CDS.1 [Saccharomyces cerevisiae]CAI6951005.1 CGH_1_HP_G0103820.mRNA.1.CDS.1 [Saccharomyces cerevisiae]
MIWLKLYQKHNLHISEQLNQTKPNLLTIMTIGKFYTRLIYIARFLYPTAGVPILSQVFSSKHLKHYLLEHMRDRYWHNMAARIQRAWRRFLQRRIDAATKIQRTIRERKEGNKYEKLRDYGTKVLGGRKKEGLCPY